MEDNKMDASVGNGSVAPMEDVKKVQDEEKKCNLMLPHSILIFVISCLTYFLVFFHRAAPSVLSAYMVKTYNCDVTDISIFTSMYYWPYAVMQPFAGLLADIFDPRYILGVASVVASIGSLICGLSKTLSFAVFGRFLVGIGAGPVYVPFCRLVTRWFPLKYYALLDGIILAAGGAGGIVAQTPLKAFALKYGWQYSFIGIAVIGVIIGILDLIFIKADPILFGYQSVNPPENKKQNMAIKERFENLWSNFKSVFSQKYMWLIAIFPLLEQSNYFNVLSQWGGPYLRAVFTSYSDANLLVALSIAMIIGNLIFPPISELIHSRKWMCVAFGLLGMTFSILMATIKATASYGTVYVFLFFFGMFTGAVPSIYLPYVRECYETRLSGSAVGATNFFPFFGGGILMSVTGDVLEKTAKVNGAYTQASYNRALWIPAAVLCGCSYIPMLFLPDTLHKKKEDEKAENPAAEPEKPKEGSENGEELSAL